MADIVALLQELGFGDYEARAYVALLQLSPLNGYEVAKRSGIPRANVYGVLQKLENRGAVVRLDTTEGARFAPVPPAELTERLQRRFQESLEATRRSLETLATPAEPAHVWNVRGYEALIEHAQSLIDATKQRLLVAVYPHDAPTMGEAMARAVARGVTVVTLCLAQCPNECGSCAGHVYRYPVAPERRQRWLVLVPDGAEVLAGEIGASEAALAVRTSQPMLVELASWYIRHSIALAAVLHDLGDRLDQLLGPETRATLHVVGPSEADGWLDLMQRLLDQRGSSR